MLTDRFRCIKFMYPFTQRTMKYFLILANFAVKGLLTYSALRNFQEGDLIMATAVLVASQADLIYRKAD